MRFGGAAALCLLSLSAASCGGKASNHTDGGAPDAGGVVDAAAPDGSAPLCLAGRVGTTPADSSDTVYDDVNEQACSSKSFCQVSCADSFINALLDCQPVGGGFFWGQGSAYLRVHGRANGACVYDVGWESEGGLQWSRCSSPFPVHAWPGLSYVDEHGLKGPAPADGLDDCVSMGSCSVLTGAPGECTAGDGGDLIAPYCPDAPGSC